ncbi:MAG: nitrogenase cofactor biosynthesis protein NifB [Deferribacterota bacterium]|nr:nitrogenase cofactor biosynthesis protein NifB [Deferribacterota bacterium]
MKSLNERHPCFCVNAHYKYGRIHLPVAPKCNIQCNYCNRKFDCSNESMPGYTSKLLTPEEAVKFVEFYLTKDKNVSVIGIAGPGDPLANPDRTFTTFNLLREIKPELLFCLSTNGLNIPLYIEDIIKAKISHCTVTLNTVNPYISEKIYRYVKLKDQKYNGLDAANILLENQLKGIELLVKNNILVKINTILIPSINDIDIINISRAIKRLGVKIHNITPLIVKKEHNTVFSRLNLRGPTEEEIDIARGVSAKIFGSYSSIMKHCKQCRADATGYLHNQSH